MSDLIVQKFLTKPYLFEMGNKKIAGRLGVSEEEVKTARQIARDSIKSGNKAEKANYIVALEEEIFRRVDMEKGTLTSETSSSYEPKDHLELAILHKIDLTKYKISNYWTKLKSNGKFTSSVFCTQIKVTPSETFVEDFKTFLSSLEPAVPTLPFYPLALKEKKGCLVLPKQDAHFNKWDVDGNNDITQRFDTVEKATIDILIRAVNNYHLEEVVYIVGSDEFNSEWTGLTTKGTPQSNILSYQDAFQEICFHNVRIINLLLQSASHVSVVFVPGNHDEFVGWHLINWLETYFREDTRIEFDSMEDNTKYFRYGNTAVMLNHGDDMKPKDLAAKFPIGFKDYWSECDYYHIITGDKHTEQVVEIGGIKIHRISQLSTSKGKWDDKKGFENRAEMTGFIITEEKGIGDILKESL